jgi:ferritin
MIDPRLEKALNDQVNTELQAWYSYLSLAVFCKSLNFNGFGAYMESHAREEQAHAHRLMNYVLDRGAKIELQAITPPSTEYGSLAEVFERAVQQEQANTRAIYQLYELAKEVNDYSTVAALQWFLDEQVEEEKVMTEAMGLMKFAGDDKSALLALNQQFGAQATTAGLE